jgi:DNA mismatch repair ATPase MutS
VNQSFGLFATHFHELSALDEYNSCIGNKHVTVQETEESITMLYQIEDGDEQRSFGINVAKLTKFPDQVIKLAQKRARELEEDTDSDEEEKSKKFKTKIQVKQEEYIHNSLVEFCRISFEEMSDEEISNRMQMFLKNPK